MAYIKNIIINLFYVIIFKIQKILALKESKVFIKKNIPNTIHVFNNKYELLDYCFLNIKIDNGFIIELGVYQGNTINYISSLVPDKKIYGFDSFEGLPEDWRLNFRKGSFNLYGKLPQVSKNVILKKGYFDKTLKVFKNEILKNNPISFLHIDADLYSSTKDAFNILSGNIVNGTIIQFDEYFNYYGWKNGEHKAFIEFIENKNLKFNYLGYTKFNEQLAVIIRYE